VGKAIAFGADDAPAGGAEAGVEAQDQHDNMISQVSP
jgi:hypothetical protein